MDFFGLGLSELFFIVIFCLLFFKPDEIPGIVRAIVTHIKKFRTMTSKVKQEIGDIYHREIESKFEEAKEELANETYGFRSKMIEEYENINHQLGMVQHDIEKFDHEHHKVTDVQLTPEQPTTNGTAVTSTDATPSTEKK